MRKFLAAVSAAALIAFPISSARSADVDIDVDITLPEVLILYCYNAVNVNISQTQLAALLNTGLTFDANGTASSTALGDAGSTTPATVNATSVVVNLSATGTAADLPTLGSKTLQLNNICAVRALATTGVNIAVTGPATVTSGSSSIALTSWGGTLTAGTVSLGTATAVNVSATMDLTNLTALGTHSSTTDVTVTATLL